MNWIGMKYGFMSALVIAILAGLTSCGTPTKASPPKQTILLQGNGVELNPYVEGVVALSQDDFQKAKVAFLALPLALQKKGTPEAANLGKLAETIASAKDIQEMRKALKPLSKSVATYADGVGVKGLTAYFCPHKNGYWLSTAVEVENPYAGAEMFSCGQAVNRVQ